MLLYYVFVLILLIVCITSLCTCFIVPGSAPHSLTVLTIQSAFVILSWMEPTIPNGIITQYEVQYKRSSDSLFTISNISSTIIGDTIIGRVEGLVPRTMYKLQIRAYTQVGVGPYSNKLTLETLSECELLYIYIYIYIFIINYH